MTFDELPMWAKIGLAELLRTQMEDPNGIAQSTSIDDPPKMLQAMKQAYLAGWLNRTSQIGVASSPPKPKVEPSPFQKER